MCLCVCASVCTCVYRVRQSIGILSQVSEEADGIRESLSQLRQSIPAQDSQQGAIDQLEKHISELMSKLMERSSSPSGKKSRRHVSHISALCCLQSLSFCIASSAQ